MAFSERSVDRHLARESARQTITHGTTMYQMRARFDAGCQLPAHQHPQEQIAHIVSGRMIMIVDGVRHELGSGQSIYLPGNVPHGVETLEDTLVIDTFSPPRDDYLAIDKAPRSRTMIQARDARCGVRGAWHVLGIFIAGERGTSPDIAARCPYRLSTHSAEVR